MRRTPLSGAWPWSIVVVSPALLAISVILATSGATAPAIGVFGSIFPWLLLLPVSTRLQLAAARSLHLSVWILAFLPAVRWPLVAIGVALLLLGPTLWHLDKDGTSFSKQPTPQRSGEREALRDTSGSFL
jgi:hypothetical protein